MTDSVGSVRASWVAPDPVFNSKSDQFGRSNSEVWQRLEIHFGTRKSNLGCSEFALGGSTSLEKFEWSNWNPKDRWKIKNRSNFHRWTSVTFGKPRLNRVQISNFWCATLGESMLMERGRCDGQDGVRARLHPQKNLLSFRGRVYGSSRTA